MIEVRFINGEETWPIRHEILRPGLPAETARFEGDHAPGTRHWGAYLDGELMGVASVMQEEGARLRGMAVLKEVQGRGVGRELVLEIQGWARRESVPAIWCYARSHVEMFYARLGFERSDGRVYDFVGVGPHLRMAWKAERVFSSKS
jgi:GNAT superfamily N-acetyltransferase